MSIRTIKGTASNSRLIAATRSSNFPLQNPVQSVSSAGGHVTAAVVTKLTASGNGLVFSSYVGGMFNDRFGGGGIGVAADGATKATGPDGDTRRGPAPLEDLLANFGPTYGVYRYGQSGWSALHYLSPGAMARGFNPQGLQAPVPLTAVA